MILRAQNDESIYDDDNEDEETETETENEQKTISEAEPEPVHKTTHSKPLIENLSAHRTAAVQLEVANHNGIALVLLTHQLVCNVFQGYSHNHALKIGNGNMRDKLLSKAPNIGTTPSMALLEAMDDKWRSKLPENFTEGYEWLLQWSTTDVMDLMAYCVSQSIDGVQTYERKSPLTQIEQLFPDFSMNDSWKPTAESYFNHIKKDDIVKIVSEHCTPLDAMTLTKMKKGDAAKRAEYLFKDSDWLPSLLMVDNPEAETEQETAVTAEIEPEEVEEFEAVA